jgi:hypothetical protein
VKMTQVFLLYWLSPITPNGKGRSGRSRFYQRKRGAQKRGRAVNAVRM